MLEIQAIKEAAFLLLSISADGLFNDVISLTHLRLPAEFRLV